jgi:hypothetical protein
VQRMGRGELAEPPLEGLRARFPTAEQREAITTRDAPPGRGRPSRVARAPAYP